MTSCLGASGTTQTDCLASGTYRHNVLALQALPGWAATTSSALAPKKTLLKTTYFVCLKITNIRYGWNVKQLTQNLYRARLLVYLCCVIIFSRNLSPTHTRPECIRPKVYGVPSDIKGWTEKEEKGGGNDKPIVNRVVLNLTNQNDF